MEPIRLIAMDMDGTLLGDGGNGIPQENVEALHAAHAAGIKLALCSGRIPDDMGFYALDVGMPMHILALNGTCSLDRPLGNIIRSQYLDPADARAIFNMTQDFPVIYGMFSDHELVVSSKELPPESLEMIFGKNILREGTRTVVYSNGEQAEKLLAQGVNKYMIFSIDDPAPLQALRARMEKELPRVEVSTSWVNNLEVNPKDANKAVALTALAESLNIPMSQVMAIGDNDNDIPMLRVAGVAVAMGNATANAKAAAHYETLPNSDGGVAAAIRTLALGESIPGVRRLR